MAKLASLEEDKRLLSSSFFLFPSVSQALYNFLR